MLNAIMGLLPSIGSFLSGGAGSSSTQNQEYESTTKGTSNITKVELPKEIRDALAGLFSNGKLGKQFNAGQASLSTALKGAVKDQANPFDVEAFVKGIMSGAQVTLGNKYETEVNSMASELGATTGDNSMAALLGSRLNTERAAELARIQQEATAQGTQIANQGKQLGAESIIGLTNAMNQQSAQFLTLLRGAFTKQRQKTTEHTKGTGSSSTESPFNWAAGLGAGLQNLGKAPE